MTSHSHPWLPPRALLRLPLADWRAHPWRHAMAWLAVALGVALAYSVHLINASALTEFSSALRAVNGEPDLVVRGPRAGFDDALFERIALAPGVELASPVLEVDTLAYANATSVPIKVIGIDALQVMRVAPQLMPQPGAGADRLALLDPSWVFLNATATQKLQLPVRDARVEFQSGATRQSMRVGGHISAGGAPLAVMDIAAAQARFGLAGRLTRIDIRLQPGFDAASVSRQFALPPGVLAARPGDDLERVSNVSRAYRVNLTVLALVALFVGAFLVYSVMALSVAQRMPSIALLGVLGLDARARRLLVMAECAAIGVGGAVVGLLLGAAMAAAALRFIAGDLGGGFFPGVQPTLQWTLPSALVFGALGVASALVGGWVPAMQAQRVQPAQALKGLGAPSRHRPSARLGLALLAAGGVLALMPPLAGLPIAAYAAVAVLLFGGVTLVPWVVGLLPHPSSSAALLRSWPRALRGTSMRLALARAHFHRDTASAMVAGVVASLALSVALTVMVSSFRGGVSDWLDAVLPADLYARSASGSAASDQVWIVEDALAGIAQLPGVARVEASRSRALALRPDLPAVMLLARPLADAEHRLPLVGTVVPAARGETAVYVSEAVRALYGAEPGSLMQLPLADSSASSDGNDKPITVRVAGVWRDYARSFGAIAIDRDRYRELTGDHKVNDLAIWLDEGANLPAVRDGIRARVGASAPLEFATTGELRRFSLAIFDRSFAVTLYLQAVAVGIALVGIAASLSAQVLARRKEFGLLTHLGLTRAQVTAVVAIETLVSLLAGIALGALLGLLVSVVLVHVVNPQSFHWTMELRIPWSRLALLCAAVLVAGLVTAWWSARRAASIDAVMAVKEDW